MPSCIVRDCRNSTYPKKKSMVKIEEEKYKRISYHKFPRDQYTRKIWLVVLGLCNCDPPKTARICSDHFNEDDFVNWSTKRTLKRTAVPVPALESISNEPVNIISKVPKLIYSEPKVVSTTSFVPSISHSSKNICDKSVNNLSPIPKVPKLIYIVPKIDSATSFTSSKSHSSENICDKFVNNLDPISKVPKLIYSGQKVVSTSFMSGRSHSSKNILDKSVSNLSPISKVPKLIYSVPKIDSATSFTSSRSHSSENICDKSVNNLSPLSKDSKSTYPIPKIVSTFSLARISSPSRITKVDASTCVSPSRLLNSPENEIIRQAYTRQIMILRQELHKSHEQSVHYKKRIETLEPILRSLKKKKLL